MMDKGCNPICQWRVYTCAELSVFFSQVASGLNIVKLVTNPQTELNFILTLNKQSHPTYMAEHIPYLLSQINSIKWIKISGQKINLMPIIQRSAVTSNCKQMINLISIIQ